MLFLQVSKIPLKGLLWPLGREDNQATSYIVRQDFVGFCLSAELSMSAVNCSAKKQLEFRHILKLTL